MKAAILFGLAAAAISTVHPALAADKVTQTRITLPDGGKPASYTGTIQGYDSAEYVFDAPAGRKLRIDFKPGHGANYFNLVQDGKDEALFVGSLGGNTFDAALPGAGGYRIKVYLMRSAARKNAKARYTLQLR